VGKGAGGIGAESRRGDKTCLGAFAGNAPFLKEKPVYSNPIRRVYCCE